MKIYPPKIGVDVDCWIGEVFIQNGQRVSAGDIICELETDKATLEFDVEYNGILRYLFNVDEKFNINEAFAELTDVSLPIKVQEKKTFSCTITIDEADYLKISNRAETTVENWISKEIKKILKEEV